LQCIVSKGAFPLPNKGKDKLNIQRGGAEGGELSWAPPIPLKYLNIDTKGANKI